MTGSDMIAAERFRQRTQEGWTEDHDDNHDTGELVQAAILYARASTQRWLKSSFLPNGWPWDAKWWKPSRDPVRNLVKAGALIAAEIDRLQRAQGAGQRAAAGKQED